MPCYRCGARQTDPVRGASPWKRGVRAGSHVLVCPDCQRAHDWTAELDRCARCGSTMLVRALGETQCRACGGSGDEVVDGAVAADGYPGAAESSSGLSQDVTAALDRLFHRAPSSRADK
jgi:hypothetical protein